MNRIEATSQSRPIPPSSRILSYSSRAVEPFNRSCPRRRLGFAPWDLQGRGRRLRTALPVARRVLRSDPAAFGEFIRSSHALFLSRTSETEHPRRYLDATPWGIANPASGSFHLQDARTNGRWPSIAAPTSAHPNAPTASVDNRKLRSAVPPSPRPAMVADNE